MFTFMFIYAKFKSIFSFMMKLVNNMNTNVFFTCIVDKDWSDSRLHIVSECLRQSGIGTSLDLNLLY